MASRADLTNEIERGSGQRPAGTLAGSYSARAAAAVIGVDERTIRRAIGRGQLPAERRGRDYQIRAEALAEYSRRREAEAPSRRAGRPGRPTMVALPAPEPPRFGPLPAALNRFIGREREIAAVAALIRDKRVRLVTLTGPGGVGKTRLAVRVAEAIQADFAGGAAFVPLAAIRAGDLVLPAMLQALHVTEQETRPPLDRLVGVLRQREALLVLDNFEQVLDAGPLVAELLRACPRLTVLVTSRAPLRITGEHLIPVAPLALPGRGAIDRAMTVPTALDEIAQADAVALFSARAGEVSRGFCLSAENASAIAQICERSDGLPLAIELAAARVRALSPADVLARMSPRLPLLQGGPRDQPDRLRAMRDAIAWSYDLLSPAEQGLFRCLAVFVGGCPLAAIEAVSSGWEQSSAEQPGLADGEDGTEPRSSSPTGVLPVSSVPSVSDLLTALIDQSLVQPQAGVAGESRFVMLETIREFGLEQLAASGDEAAIRDAHANWCIAFAERAQPELAGPDHVVWFNRLEAEIGNIRAAHAWLFERRDPARALTLGTTHSWFWTAAGYLHEGRALFQRLLVMPGADASPSLFARALGCAGSLDQLLGRFDDAQRHTARALAIAQELGDQGSIVSWQRTLGSIAIDQGDLDTATSMLGDVAAAEPVGESAWATISAEYLLGIVAYTRGDYAMARRHAEAAQTAWQELGDLGHAGAAQLALARAALAAGERWQAAVAGREVLAQLADVADDAITADCFELAAELAWRDGTGRTAARLLAAAEAMRGRMGTPRWPGYQTVFAQLRTEVREVTGAARFDADWVTGETLSLAAANAEAFAAFQRAAGEGKRPGRTSADVNALTPRERTIVRLLVDGLSDKEIAATLGISRHTASNHVTAIRDKLGASSRAGAAAIAVRDQLV